MGYDDFCAMTPRETACVFSAYREKVDGVRRDAWERMRLSACIGIQPHIKKKMTPSKLVPLPWDYQREKAAEQLTAEERERRKRIVLERWKNGKGSQV